MLSQALRKQKWQWNPYVTLWEPPTLSPMQISSANHLGIPLLTLLMDNWRWNDITNIWDPPAQNDDVSTHNDTPSEYKPKKRPGKKNRQAYHNKEFRKQLAMIVENDDANPSTAPAAQRWQREIAPCSLGFAFAS